ncbi:uncharacterized protein LOC108149994 [Drosophila elegans]|uniref:uncharacterized protein LOC108149994 n=1 Tax=Drosophila elegans TaxID=30023 RepID=UPI0007E60355|nr:uncharacterized protein LOC108149994 [Drosophila elegans]
MATIIKMIIVFWLFEHFHLGQVYHIESSGVGVGHLRPGSFNQKKQSSWAMVEFQEHGPSQWQSQSGICSAENVHDVRYEKSGGSKTTKKIVKDENDDESADPAAIGQNGGNQDGNKKVFVGRISCLLGAIQKHTNAMTDNLKILQSRLCKVKGQGKGKVKGKIKGKTNGKGTVKSKGKVKGKGNGKGKSKSQEKSKSKSPGSTCGKSTINPLLSGHPTAKCSQKPKTFADQKQCTLDDTATEKRLKTLGSNTVRGDRRKPVSPLLRLIHGPALRQTHLKSRQGITFSADKSQWQYEEYDAKLRSLMANRDAIDRSVAKLMGPRQKGSI